MTEKGFFQQVYDMVKKIPEGNVASYGQIATLIGNPRAARQVGWALNGLQKTELEMNKIPWWRVVNQKGYLSIRGDDPTIKYLQKDLLEKEGIEVGDDLTINMNKYRWNDFDTDYA